MATNKDILLKDKNNNNLYPLVHQDYNQHILDEFYFGLNGFLPANTDLNTIKKVGSYWLQSNTQYINAPGPWNDPGTWTTGLLIVYKSRYGYDRRIIQEVIKVGSNSFNTYYRYCDSGGAWKNWYEPDGSGGGQGDITAVYGGGILSGGGTSGSLTITHKTPTNNVEKTAEALYPIKIDSYGHITSVGAAQNLPTEATVSDWGFTKNLGTITGVSVNGTSVATSGVANITVPTKTSQLTNNSNFVVDSNYVHTDNNFTTILKNKLDGIESGAQENTIEHILVNGTEILPVNKSVDITIDNNEDILKLTLHDSIKKCFKKWRPIKNFSFLTSQDSTYKTGIIYSCNIESGLPYSSVIFNDSDILWNRNLSTFYSSLENPGSIVYQGPVNKLANNQDYISKARSNYYGMVCSTFASKILGSPIYYTTAEMRKMGGLENNPIFSLKDYTDSNDLKIGTPLVNSVHILFIYDILKDLNNNIIKIAVAEEKKPITAITIYSLEEFETNIILKSGYKIGEFKNCEPILLDKIEYNKDIITEYGDKTWFKQGNDIYLYIPEIETPPNPSGTVYTKYLYYRVLGSSTWSNIKIINDTGELVNGVTSKQVNGVNLYNIIGTNLFNSCNNYEFALSHSGTSTSRYYSSDSTIFGKNNPYYIPAKISIIDMGTISIDDSTSTCIVSNYSNNLTPDWYEVKYLINYTSGQKNGPVYINQNGSIVDMSDSYIAKTDYNDITNSITYKNIITSDMINNNTVTFTFNKPTQYAAGGTPGQEDEDEPGGTTVDGYYIIVHFKNEFGSPSIGLGHINDN